MNVLENDPVVTFLKRFLIITWIGANAGLEELGCERIDVLRIVSKHFARQVGQENIDAVGNRDFDWRKCHGHADVCVHGNTSLVCVGRART